MTTQASAAKSAVDYRTEIARAFPFEMPDSIKILEVWQILSEGFDGQTIRPDIKTRRRDRETPAIIHPVFGACAVMHECVPRNIRIVGFYVLTFHDVYEEFKSRWTEENMQSFDVTIDCWSYVKKYVMEMTFKSFDYEFEFFKDNKIDPVLALFKLFDKISNLLDCEWMEKDKLVRYIEHVERVITATEVAFPKTNIAAMCKGIILQLREKMQL